jgi:hypothetical protein
MMIATWFGTQFKERGGAFWTGSADMTFTTLFLTHKDNARLLRGRYSSPLDRQQFCLLLLAHPLDVLDEVVGQLLKFFLS